MLPPACSDSHDQTPQALADQAVQHARVEDKAGCLVDRSSDTHLQNVIMPMPMRIIALPVKFAVLVPRLRSMQTVRS